MDRTVARTCVAAAFVVTSMTPADAADGVRALAAAHFEPAAGAPDRFMARFADRTVVVRPDAVAIRWLESVDPPTLRCVELRFDGADPDAAIAGVEPLPGRSHYYLGDDPAAWRVDVSHFRAVRVRDARRGVDLIHRVAGGRLEFDLLVEPWAAVDDVTFSIHGADDWWLDEDGGIVVRAGDRFEDGFRIAPPTSTQEGPLGRSPVSSAYVARGDGAVGISLGRRDPSLPVLIDPEVVWATYLGSGLVDLATVFTRHAYDVEIDGTGRAVVCGYTGTTAAGLLAPSGQVGSIPVQGDHSGHYDTFVTRFDPTGSALEFLTYVGGSEADVATGGLALVAQFGLYLAGATESDDFPTLNATQPSRSGSTDAFVLRLDAAGHLAFSTYLGGTRNDEAHDVAVGPYGNAVVVGSTKSSTMANAGTPDEFPTTPGAWQQHRIHPPPSDDGWFGGDRGGFAAKYNLGGVQLYATLLDGESGDWATAAAVDADGWAWVAGSTDSAQFPLVLPTQSQVAGVYDVFLCRLAPLGGSASFSTFLGGGGFDHALGLEFGPDGVLHLAVDCYAVPPAFPGVSAAAFGQLVTTKTTVVARLVGNPPVVERSHLVPGCRPAGIAVDRFGAAYVTGVSGPNDPFPLLRALPANPDHFGTVLFKLSTDGRHLAYATYLGGPASDRGLAVAVDDDLNAHVVGHNIQPPPFEASSLIAGAPVSMQRAPAVNGAWSQGFVIKVDSSCGDDAPMDTDGGGASSLLTWKGGVVRRYEAKNGALIGQHSLGDDPEAAAVALDHDGDGQVEFATYRDGIWTLYDGEEPVAVVDTGSGPEAQPVPCDHDGDGRDDLGVFELGTWRLFDAITGEMIESRELDAPPGAVAYAYDRDGDGADDLTTATDETWALHDAAGAVTSSFPRKHDGLEVDVSAFLRDVDGDCIGDVFDLGYPVIVDMDAGTTETIPEDVAAFDGCEVTAVPLDHDGDGIVELTLFGGGLWVLLHDDLSVAAAIEVGEGERPIHRWGWRNDDP